MPYHVVLATISGASMIASSAPIFLLLMLSSVSSPQPLHSHYPHLGCRQRHPPPQVGSGRISPPGLGPRLGLVGWTSSWMQVKSPEIASCAQKTQKKIGAVCAPGAGGVLAWGGVVPHSPCTHSTEPKAYGCR